MCGTPPGTPPSLNGFNANVLIVSSTPNNAWVLKGVGGKQGALFCQEITRALSKTGDETFVSLSLNNAQTSISTYCLEVRIN